MSVWMWFPDAIKRFSGDLERSATAFEAPEPTQFQKWWHWPSAGIVAIVTALLSSSMLANDVIIEWMERIGTRGFVFFGILMAVQALLATIILLRILHFILWYRSTLTGGLKIRPTDPDGQGGLGFVGAMFGRLTIFALSMGLWAFWFVALGFFRNHNGDLDSGNIGFFVVNVVAVVVTYVTLVGIILVYPTVMTRRLMVRARDGFLMSETKLSHEVDRVSRYFLIKQYYPVSPFPAWQWAILRLLSLLPPVVGVLSAMTQWTAR